MSACEGAPLPIRFVIPTTGRACSELVEGDLQFLLHGTLPRKASQKLAWRWIKFNLVGGIGIVVQLAALWVLVRVFLCNYLLATALAVEAAVLHNFLWHQHVTWADRIRNHWRDSAVRLLRFNLTNGLVSILGNLIMMRTLVGGFHVRIAIANLLSVACCSAVNFLLSEMYVFRLRRA